MFWEQYDEILVDYILWKIFRGVFDANFMELNVTSVPVVFLNILYYAG